MNPVKITVPEFFTDGKRVVVSPPLEITVVEIPYESAYLVTSDVPVMCYGHAPRIYEAVDELFSQFLQLAEYEIAGGTPPEGVEIHTDPGVLTMEDLRDWELGDLGYESGCCALVVGDHYARFSEWHLNHGYLDHGAATGLSSEDALSKLGAVKPLKEHWWTSYMPASIREWVLAENLSEKISEAYDEIYRQKEIP